MESQNRRGRFVGIHKPMQECTASQIPVPADAGLWRPVMGRHSLMIASFLTCLFALPDEKQALSEPLQSV